MKTSLKISLAILGTILYNYLFWQSEWGINLWLFSAFLMVSLLLLYPNVLSRKRIVLLGLCTFLTGGMVVLNNSLISKVVHIISFVSFTGFVFEQNIRSVIYGMFTGLSGIFYVPQTLQGLLNKIEIKQQSAKRNLKLLRLAFIPLIFLSIFFFMFRLGNPKFAAYSDTFIEGLSDFFYYLFADFSFVHMMFLVLGIFIVTSVLFGLHSNFWAKVDTQENNYISRQRIKSSVQRFFKMLDLKNEYLMGIILVGLVNVLLVIVNYIDIDWLWFNFDYREAGNLSLMVHEGTYILIASILLSIAILLFFFRRNINFLADNQLLKNLSYLWIVQNFILVISVALRTYYYIHTHGLAYKRIGVLVFLLLTVFGLFTLWLKIARLHSFSHLIRSNVWAVYLVFIGLCMIDWDNMIVDYNLKHPNLYSGEIDYNFLMSRDERTLLLLAKNQKRIPAEEQDILKNRVYWFINNYEKRQWVAWNYADAKTYDYLKTNFPKQKEL